MTHDQNPGPSTSGSRPLYPVPPIDPAEVPGTVEIVWFSGFAFARAGGHWRLVDAAALPVRDTDD